MIQGLFVLIGAFALAAQTLLLREYLVLHGGNELAVGLFYASWFSWIAVAAIAVRRLGRPRGDRLSAASRPTADEPADHRRRDSASESPRLARAFALLVAAYPIALVGQILLIRATRSLADVPPTEPLSFGALGWWTLVTNAPVSLVTGAIFPAGCAALRAAQPTRSASRTVAGIYIYESAGAFVGGLLVTALASAWVPAIQIALGAACALAAGAGAYALRGRRPGAAVVHLSLALVALVGLVSPWGAALASSSALRRFADILPQAELVASRDTPHQHAAVARIDDQVLLLSNGRLVAALPDDETHAMSAALLMSQAAQARRILLIGAGAQGLVQHLLDYPSVERLLYVEPDEPAFRLAHPHLPPADRLAFEDPRVELRFTDGRLLVNESARHGAERFDLALVVMPDPDTAALNRYFTLEFYRAVASLLSAEGVFATRISSGENVLAGELASYGASIVQTLHSAFADVVATPGEESWLLASNAASRVSVDADEVARRYRALALPKPRFAAAGFEMLLDPDRVRFVAQTYQRSAAQDPHGLLNRDSRPVTYFLNLLVLGRHTDSAAVGALWAIRDVGAWLFVLPLLILLALHVHFVTGAKRSARPPVQGTHATVLLVGFGLASIALQLVLIFSFQSRFGLVFEQIGLVNALFMVGLALGAVAVLSLARRDSAAAAGGADGTGSEAKAIRRALVIIGLTIILAIGLPSIAQFLGAASAGTARTAFYGLFLFAGALSGAAFPLGGQMAAPSEGAAGRVGAVAASADHWGAALGAALIGTVAAPLFGLQATCTIVAAVLAGCALVLVLAHPGILEGWRRVLVATRLWPVTVLTKARAPRSSFPWRRTSYLLFAVTAIVTVAATQLRQAMARPPVSIGPHRLSATVRADRFEAHRSPFLHYRAFNAGQDRFHNVTFASLALTEEIQGYAGPLNLLVSIDGDGTIRAVDLISSDETPAYIAGIGQWLQRFEGKDGTKPFLLSAGRGRRHDHDLDGLTGATVTSRAAVETVNAAARAASTRLLGLQMQGTVRIAGPSPWTGAVLYLIIAFLLAIPVMLRPSATVRTAFLASNLVLGGVIYNVQLSVPHLVELSRGSLPTPANPLLFVLLLAVVLLAVAFGPGYCAMLCPFGAAQELSFHADRRGRPSGRPAGRTGVGLSRWLRPAASLALLACFVDLASPTVLPDVANRGVRDALLAGAVLIAYLLTRKLVTAAAGPVTQATHGRARYVKYVLLATVLTVVALTGSDELLTLDPLTLAFSGSYGGFAFALLVAIWLCSLRYFRFWCRLFCPVGALLNLFNKLGLLLRFGRPKRPRHCDLGVRSTHDVDCIQCNRCITSVGTQRCLAAPATGAHRAQPRREPTADAQEGS